MITEPETCQNLTREIYNRYGNRKKPGRISLFVDTKRKTTYLVPRKEEHIDFARRITQPRDYSRLVPVHIDTEIQNSEPTIIGIIIGICGLEIKLGVRHNTKDLEKAHDITWRMVNASEVRTGRIREDRIVMKYAIKDTRSKYKK